jgi:hypothetical protein
VEFDDAALVLSSLACQPALACRALLCGLIFGNDFLRRLCRPQDSSKSPKFPLISSDKAGRSCIIASPRSTGEQIHRGLV